jgi:hypothetical protein
MILTSYLLIGRLPRGMDKPVFLDLSKLIEKPGPSVHAAITKYRRIRSPIAKI